MAAQKAASRARWQEVLGLEGEGADAVLDAIADITVSGDAKNIMEVFAILADTQTDRECRVASLRHFASVYSSKARCCFEGGVGQGKCERKFVA